MELNQTTAAVSTVEHTYGVEPSFGVSLDYSNHSLDDKYLSQLTVTEDFLVAFYLLVCEVMSIILNSFVIGLSIHQRKKLKPSDVFVVYLAFSDIGHPLLAYPMIIASSFMHRWLFGDIGCLVNAFTSCFFGINSILTLTVMSFSRYIYVTNFNWARNHGFPLAISLIIFAFLFTLLWAVSPLVGWGQYSPEPFGTSCTIDWNNPSVSYVTSSFVFCLAIPILIMTFSYGNILYLALKTRHRRMQWGTRTKENKLWEKNEMRLLKMTVCMCATFITCWGPYAVLAMVKTYAKHVTLSPQVSVIPTMAAKASHVIDPFIYCVLNKNFSRLIPKMMAKKRADIERDQTTLSVPLKNLAKENSDLEGLRVTMSPSTPDLDLDIDSPMETSHPDISMEPCVSEITSA